MAVFQNQATLSYNGNTVNSNVTNGQLIDVLSMTKTVADSAYSLNNDVTYMVGIVNSGTSAYTGLNLTDDLGTYLHNTFELVPLDYVDGSINYFINGVLQAPPAVTTEDGISISGINVPAEGNAVIVFVTTVNEFAPFESGSMITNTATLTGTGLPNDITATAVITADAVADLTITKSVYPATVTATTPLDYTFIIQNYGNTEADAGFNAVVSDIFDPILTNISVTFNGSPWSEPGNYTYNAATGEFATVPSQITVPAAFAEQSQTGEWVLTPGVSILTVTGTVA